jgi:hypothetical protein
MPAEPADCPLAEPDRPLPSCSLQSWQAFAEAKPELAAKAQSVRLVVNWLHGAAHEAS